MTGPQPPYGAPPQQPQQQPQPQQNRLPNQQRPLPQPGWYRHPYTGQTMYWTGTQWSATQPAQSTQAKPVQPGPAKAVAVDARKRRKWIIVASIVAALALVVGVSVPIVRFLERQGIIEVPSLKSMSKEEAYGTTFTADRFDLQDPLIDISNSRKFSMDLESETAQDLAKSEELEACDFLCVYGNANLDAPVEASYDLVDGTRLEITGMSRPDAAQDDNDISKYNLGFSGYEHYWLVQWRDAQGERLAKPKISVSRVRIPEGAPTRSLGRVSAGAPFVFASMRSRSSSS